jgi:UTP--glucose-1-phosphate uridylyltransferase
MKIRRAVVTAAAARQRTLPLQKVVDRDGEPKSVLRILVDESHRAGIDAVAVVVCPGDQAGFEAAIGDCPVRVSFVEQPEPRGYGHAVYCARDFVADEPFLHFVGDHLFVAHGDRGCAQQLVELAQREAAAVSAVQATRESLLTRFGTIGGQRVAGRRDLYVVEQVREKPTPTEAEQDLIVPGLRAGHYLCFFGMHVLTPAILPLLEAAIAEDDRPQSGQMSRALDELARRERYLALQVQGARYDMGERYGLFTAQLALALTGVDHQTVLTHVLEVLAERERERG